MSERDSEADQSTTLLCLVLEYLPHNDIAIAGRLTSQDAARHFSSANYRTARLSRSLTPHAAQSFQLHTQPLMRNLTFRKKLGLLAVAAASGSEANMAVAWSLLRPHLFPELLPSQSALGTPALRDLPYSTICGDAGRVACERGHPYLVHWMVQHGCPLSPTPALEAAARHCDLGTLRELWQLLRPLRGAHLDQQVWHVLSRPHAHSNHKRTLHGCGGIHIRRSWLLPYDTTPFGIPCCKVTPELLCAWRGMPYSLPKPLLFPLWAPLWLDQ